MHFQVRRGKHNNHIIIFNILPQILPLDETVIQSEVVRQIQDFRKNIDPSVEGFQPDMCGKKKHVETRCGQKKGLYDFPGTYINIIIC